MSNCLRSMARCAALAVMLLTSVLRAPITEAETVVRVQNNTHHDFRVRGFLRHLEGQGLPAGSFEWPTLWVPFGTRTEVLRFDRGGSVPDDSLHHFDTHLTDRTTFPLRQRLEGTLLHSDLWQGVVGGTLYGDRDWHASTWVNEPGERLEVLFRAYLTPGDDDIEYVVNPAPRPDVPEGELHVLAYNVYLRPPVFRNGQAIRAGLLPDRLRQFDVIVLNEVFDEGYRSDLLQGLAAEYPYQTRVVGEKPWLSPFEDGGVVIVSRWPIVAEDARTFGSELCCGTDCLADKGVGYAAIEKHGRRYHVFGTHLQAGEDEGCGVRNGQLAVIRGFIDALDVPAEEPVLIAGDMNISIADRRERDDMTGILDAWIPDRFGILNSIDPLRNELSSSGTHEHIDYVLVEGRHRSPVKAGDRGQMETLLVRSRYPWKEYVWEPEIWDLSDHYPVRGRFALVEPTQRLYARTHVGDVLEVAPELAWRTRNLSVDHVSPGHTFAGAPVAIDHYTRSTRVQHVFGRNASDELEHYYRIAGGGWRAENLTHRAHIGSAFTIVGDPVVVNQQRSNQPTQHVFARNVADELIVYSWSNLGGWDAENLTLATQSSGDYRIHGQPAVDAFGDAVGKALHVFGRNAGHELVHFFWHTTTGTWRAENLTTQLGGGPSLWLASDPVIDTFDSGGTLVQHVFARSFGGELLHYYWSAQAGWQVETINDKPGIGSGFRFATPPRVLHRDSGGVAVQHVFVRNTSGHVLQFYWTAQGGWRAEDLTQKPGIGIPYRIYGALQAVNMPNRGIATQHLFGRNLAGDVIHYYWSPQQSWKAENLTTKFAAIGTGFRVVEPLLVANLQVHGTPTQHLFARDAAGDLVHYHWDPQNSWRAQHVVVPDALDRGLSVVAHP